LARTARCRRRIEGPPVTRRGGEWDRLTRAGEEARSRVLHNHRKRIGLRAHFGNRSTRGDAAPGDSVARGSTSDKFGAEDRGRQVGVLHATPAVACPSGGTESRPRRDDGTGSAARKDGGDPRLYELRRAAGARHVKKCPDLHSNRGEGRGLLRARPRAWGALNGRVQLFDRPLGRPFFGRCAVFLPRSRRLDGAMPEAHGPLRA
jgi:hypothetical protein